MRIGIRVGLGVVLCGLLSGCGSEDPSEPGASGGSGATGVGGAGGAGGASGSGAVSSGGSTGQSGSGGSATGGAGGGPGACGAITTFESGLSPTREIHVAENGSDTSGTGSADNPYASIDQAARQVTAGTAVRVHAGTYAGGAYLADLAGSAREPIWIGGAPGEARPIIEGGADAFHLTRARYVIVHDLEIRGQTANGINADDGDDRASIDASRHLVFRNLWIHDVGSGGNQDCLKLSGLNDFFVLNSEFARCGGGSSGSGIDHVGCHSGLIAQNRFEALTGGGNAVQCKGGSEDIEIRSNLFIDGGERAVNMGGSTGFEFFRPPLSTSQPNAEARNIRVIANVIQGSTAALAFVGCVDCLAANNTIVDPQNWILRILQETTSDAEYAFLEAQNGRFVNNLIYFARGALSTDTNVGAGTLPETFTFANNLWYAHDDPSASEPTALPVTETNGRYGEDPLLRAPETGDYSIPPSSPAAAAGVTLPELGADFSGACWQSPPSIGAFEAN